MEESQVSDKPIKPSGFWPYIWDRLLDSVDVIVAKFTSGSFITTLALVGTYCWVAKHLVSSIPQEKITSDFVFGFVAGLASSVMFVLKAYFDKSQNGGSNAESPAKPNP